jgi:heat shock protein HslJ
MTKITAFFSLLLMLCLSACMTAGENMETGRLHGLWQNEKGQFFHLEEDGSLSLLRNSSASGVSWDFDGTALTLTTVDAPGKEAAPQKLFLQKRGLWGLEFLDEEGKQVKWSRSFKQVKHLEGTLFFRERIMLPPEVNVGVRLLTKEGAIAGQNASTLSGRAELKFRVCFLASDLEDNAALEASVFYGREPLFTAPSGTKVSLDGHPSVLLHHAVPNHEQELPLKGTYWRLKELDGKLVESFPGQPEAHLILREKGEAAGSDGCNNFFMGWEESDGNISFTPGGSTLRLCPEGEEQAQKMLQMFPLVNEWKISDGKLELCTEDSVAAIFEAVEM